ncbi:GIY-YIG nuclease family protein [Candidatus Gottesmanbacteria bacterium]|nr:GIY-YIG nuclease family protein [Candidatus Gottesmanbacteria bacterium]
MYYVYVLKSRKDSLLYIGYTNNLKRRLVEHSKDNRAPWTLIYYESYLSDHDARQREEQLKRFKSAYGFLKRRMKDSISRA